MSIEIEKIMSLIPHRYPFLLVDKVIELNVNSSIVGIKNVTFNEPQFMGHFPKKPIMPGVLIIEALAQLSGILICSSIPFKADRDVYFMSIKEAKFRRLVIPGDTLYLYSKIEQNRSRVWKCSSCAYVSKNLVAESKFTAMIKDRN